MKYSILSVLVGSLLLSGCGGGGGSDAKSTESEFNTNSQEKSIFENIQLYYTFEMKSDAGRTYKSTINLSIKSNGGLSGEWNSPYGNFIIIGSAGNNDPNLYLVCFKKGNISSECTGEAILNTNPGLLFIAANNDQKTKNCSLVESISKNKDGSILIKPLNHFNLNAICKDANSDERYFAKYLNVSINGAAPILVSGSTDATSSDNTNYISWNNSVNGTIVKDGSNQSFAVQASDGIVVDLQRNTRLNGTQVLKNNNADLVIDGKVVGNVGYTTATNGGQITVFNCKTGGQMTFTISGNQYTWNCPNGSSGSTGSSEGNSNDESYVNWNGNANGSTIKDGNNRSFAVYSSNRMLVDIQNGIELRNAIVNNNANLIVDGKVIGSVVQATASNGSKIAVLNCSTGGRMTFSNSGSQYTWHCPDGGTGSTSGSNSGMSGGKQGISATQCIRLVDQGNDKYVFRNSCSDIINISYTINGLGGTYITLRAGESTFNTVSKTDQYFYNACVFPSVPMSDKGGCNSY
ncbi:hypothetical protein F889_00511 [Acinetobacter colistiniresistens]|uniref:Lipoprotein n=1 Tax=Acinetobacter colistiniresistens TaxID=280145 RepID=N9PRZ9_9GAMM|nr:hypothetical protein [Acinetobacter colistiniresistens]ENX36349.1 hypothetical protein F889_00511 [Acinetobacter colistiniresistens]